MNMHRTLYIPVVILLLLTIGLELLSIHLSQKLASDSIAVKKLQDNIARLDEENQILNVRLLSQTSFDQISKKAVAMGFSEKANYLTLQDNKLSFQDKTLSLRDKTLSLSR